MEVAALNLNKLFLLQNYGRNNPDSKENHQQHKETSRLRM